MRLLVLPIKENAADKLTLVNGKLNRCLQRLKSEAVLEMFQRSELVFCLLFSSLVVVFENLVHAN